MDALLIDDKARKIRFLRVETGGFLGIGEKKSLIPIDAIASISEDEVHLNHTRSQVSEAPPVRPGARARTIVLHRHSRELRIPALLGSRIHVPRTV
ncbi:PRC-barrel domain-containing protein [Glaciihabitans sp. UYNi722]|uniref:PRC-barrel domain-containing protein n=1 Tax=Glaciihabitans sp. UYNi722 TaxID=3156344 RepID=UPI0033998596